MKKEPTIKNVLAEISHIEARIYNLTDLIKEKGITEYGYAQHITSYLDDSMMDIGKAETEVKDLIHYRMLK